MQSLETKSSRPRSFDLWDRDETWDLRDRDFKKRVSRPRPSLETPSLVTWLNYFVVFKRHKT